MHSICTLHDSSFPFAHERKLSGDPEMKNAASLAAFLFCGEGGITCVIPLVGA
jgi:hypothetical protein